VRWRAFGRVAASRLAVPEEVYASSACFAFRPPAWGQEIVVIADAADASRAKMALIQELGYWYVVALPRTWKCANGKTLKALVTHLPRWWSWQIRLPTRSGARRRTCWV
jgi:hypothetical protein